MKLLKNWLMESFGFTRTEMNGTWLLIALIVVFAVVPRVYINARYAKKEIPNQDRAELAAWASKIQSAITIKEEKKRAYRSKSTFENKKSNSNPTYKNDYRLAYSDKEKTKTDTKLDYKKKYAPAYTAESKLDLNRATATQLQKIKGIGPVLSERIVKYRDYLGGFASYDQIREVYGLKPEVVEKLSEITFVEGDIISIELNTDSIKLLAAHPYIDYKLARSIINYRKVHGNYTAPEELLSLKLMTDSLYQKLYPYISKSQ
ncbi:MAG: helix-hairpin-helix domain-containing protein [Cyclobacteriaceae bacterium]